MTNGLRILTLVACSGDGRQVLPDGNDFLRQVTSVLELETHRQPDARGVQRIRSVNEIWPAVREFHRRGAGPIALQIVGHGRPGELELASSWDRCYRDELRFYVLDNNSRALQLLARCRGLVSEVRLVACELGAEPGYPLLFTLSRLLDCPIFAALGSVEPGQFRGASGLFSGPLTRCARGTQRFSTIPAVAPQLSVQLRTLSRASGWLEPRSLRFVRACTVAVRDELLLAEDERAMLLRHVTPLVGAEPGGSAFELEFEVSVRSMDGEARARLALRQDRTGHLFAERERALRLAVTVELDEPTLARLLARYCAA